MFKLLNRYFRFFRLSIYSLFTKGTRNSAYNISKKESALLKLDSFNIVLNTFVLQGICLINDYIFITAYDDKREQNSKIMIFKDKKLEHETDLNTKSHVGGICFDNIHNIIWITDSSGTISGYEYEDIIKNDKAYPKYKKIKVINEHINIYGNNATAFITYFNNKLYVGNYHKQKYSAIIEYNIQDNGLIDLDSCRVIKGLDFVQGIFFYEDDGNTYLLASSSFILKKSLIKVFKYNDDITDLGKEMAVASYKMGPMLEQIAIDKSKILYAVFESNALKFKKYRLINNDVELYDLAKGNCNDRGK